MREIERKLLYFGRKTISLKELASVLRINLYETEQLYVAVMDLVERGLIIAVKASDTNGNRSFPLYTKYRITIKDEFNDDETERKIKSLNPIMLRSGYLSRHKEAYKENTKVIEKLSSFFFAKSTEEFISRKERSYQLFGKEKILDEKSVQSPLVPE